MAKEMKMYLIFAIKWDDKNNKSDKSDKKISYAFYQKVERDFRIKSLKYIYICYI